MTKSVWDDADDEVQKVSGEIIEQINRGVAPWQKPWKPGEHSTPEDFSTLRRLRRAKRDGHPKPVKDPSEGTDG